MRRLPAICVALGLAGGCEYSIDDIPLKQEEGSPAASDARAVDHQDKAIDGAPELGADAEVDGATDVNGGSPLDGPSDVDAALEADASAGDGDVSTEADRSYAPDVSIDASLDDLVDDDSGDDTGDVSSEAATENDAEAGPACPTAVDAGASSQPPPSGQVAVAAVNADTLNVLAVGADGALYARSLFHDCPWTVKAISRSDFAPPGAPIALDTSLVGGFRAYLVGKDGVLDVFAVDGAGSWSGPVPVGAAGFAPVGAALAVAPLPTGEMAIFAVSGTGAVRAILADAPVDGGASLILTDDSFAPAGAPLTLLSQAPGQLEVLVVGNDGAPKDVVIAGSDAGPDPSFPDIPNLAPPGAPITAALHRPSQNDVFVVGNDGKLKVYWVDDLGWHSPIDLTYGQWATPGATVSTVRDESIRQLDIFVVNAAGDLNAAWVQGTDPFHGPFPVGEVQGLAQAGATSAEVFHWGNRLELITVGTQRLFESWTTGNVWHAPIYLP